MLHVTGANAEVVRALYDAADADVATELMEPDCEWVESEVAEMPFSGTFLGTQAVRNGIYERVSEFFETFGLFPDRILEAEGGVVVATGRVRASTKLGTRLDAPFAHVFELREGKIRRCINYHDSALWLRALDD